MRKLSFILIALALFAPMLSFGQYFQRLHDVDSSGDFGWNVFVQDDGNYFVTTGAYSSTTFKAQQGWMNISQDGGILSNKRLLSSSLFHYYQGLRSGEVKKLQDGGYLIPASVAGNQKSSIGMIRLNEQLDTVFTKFYTDTSLYREDVSACELLINGNFLLGGYHAIGTMPMDSALIICTDDMGNIKWKRHYKKIAGEQPCIVSLQALDNGRILVGAMSTHLVGVGMDVYGHNTPWFMIIDSLGEIIKDTAYVNTAYGGGGVVFRDVYGGYYHIGAFDSCYTQDPLDLINFPEYLMHLNENFEIDWVRNFGTLDGHKYIWRVEQLPDGNFQLSGANGVNGDPRLKGWAARVDHNGWTIWDNDYTCDTNWSSYLVDFDVQQDGSLVLVGAARNDTVPQWRGQELWLVSVDANGCLQPGCAPTVVKEEMVEKQADLLVYPNPTSVGNFIVECTGAGKLAILTPEGKLIGEREVKEGSNHVTLPRGMAGGMYLVRYIPDGGTPVNKKLIYQP